MQKNILEIQIQVMAVMTRIEGMKARNKIAVQSKQYAEYDEIDFERKACELDSLWQELTRCE